MYEDYLREFEFVKSNVADECHIRLTQQPYKGIVVCLAKHFEIHDGLTGEGEQNIVFDYEVIETPAGVQEYTIEGEDFRSELGGILLALIERHMEQQEKVNGQLDT